MLRDKKISQHSIAYDVKKLCNFRKSKKCRGSRRGSSSFTLRDSKKNDDTWVYWNDKILLCKYEDEVECTDPLKWVNTILLRDFK